MRHKSDGEARPARCHDRPACLAPRRRLEVQLQDFQIFFALRGAAQLANRGIRRGGARKLCRASACGGICDVSTSTSKSATPDNSPTVPTSSSDAATRCATRKVASQCEDPGATEASETGKKCDVGIDDAKVRVRAAMLQCSVRLGLRIYISCMVPTTHRARF